jgi:two-component system, NarL family, nitrate/nitrite response regulator NarL
MYLLRVLLIVDVPFYREGLQRLIAQDGGVVVVGAVRGDEALAAVSNQQPTLVLLDISPPAARAWLDQLRSLPQPPRVVVLAVDETRESVLEWIEAGASGYVDKNSSASELIQVMHQAARGEWCCSPRVMAMVMQRLSTLAASSRATLPALASATLTAREQQILELVGQGLSNKRIAIALNISHATAKNHVHHILGKLQLRNRTEVAAYLRGLAPVVVAHA